MEADADIQKIGGGIMRFEYMDRTKFHELSNDMFEILAKI